MNADPGAIFELIVKADEKLKYATEANDDVRRQQAVALLREAAEAARAIGNESLVRQATTRLADIGQATGEAAGEAGGPTAERLT